MRRLFKFKNIFVNYGHYSLLTLKLKIYLFIRKHKYTYSLRYKIN